MLCNIQNMNDKFKENIAKLYQDSNYIKIVAQKNNTKKIAKTMCIFFLIKGCK